VNTMPMATYLAVEATRRQFDPQAAAEYEHDPIRWPRFRTARALLARALHATARAIAPPPTPPAPRLSSAVCRG
jgi:hypothetical protein